MSKDPYRPRPFALLAFGLLATLGATTAIAAAFFDTYALCAVGLFVLGGSALGAYRTAQAADVRTDHVVLQRLRQAPVLDADALATDLDLRPAAVRLSLHRLSRNGDLPASNGSSARR
ncbi:hypothetical protein ABTX81_05725 [Kitasatospora sp. NPDC097605]|uniref:hypothetical protein n=1 Tax=Kitasatospora sp. NPDC097605 TaxID=3157226 RepID=UPI00332D5817